MKVFVNNNEVHVAPGMTVRHAIIGAGLMDDVNAGKKVVDEWDNELGLDGGLFEDYKIFVRGYDL